MSRCNDPVAAGYKQVFGDMLTVENHRNELAHSSPMRKTGTGDHLHMPTANTTSPRPKAAAKQATAKRASTRAKAAGTAHARSAGTAHARSAGNTNAQAGVKTARSTPEVVGGYAERAVLIPVGAALIARERVGEVIATYSTPTKAQTQLRRFERRGSTARNRLEREVRKTRTRVERELRRRRQDGSDLVERVQERVLNLV
jgi:hypothetical protein